MNVITALKERANEFVVQHGLPNEVANFIRDLVDFASKHCACQCTKNRGRGNYNELLSIDETVAFTRASRVVIQRMSQKKYRDIYNNINEVWRRFPRPVRIGLRIFYRRGELEEWLDFARNHRQWNQGWFDLRHAGASANRR